MFSSKKTRTVDTLATDVERARTQFFSCLHHDLRFYLFIRASVRGRLHGSSQYGMGYSPGGRPYFQAIFVHVFGSRKSNEPGGRVALVRVRVILMAGRTRALSENFSLFRSVEATFI